MKKTFFVLAGLAACMLVFSCASTEFTQEDANIAFGKVYDTFRDELILEGAKSYTVVQGDTLSAITRRNYGGKNGYFFPLIMLASSDVVLDPDSIEPGMALTIPDLEKNLSNSQARKKLQKFLEEIARIYDKKGREETRNRLKALAASL
ncbi:MAG: LysM peptidoglycan-binding domain-containing protein [Treponema sp.]|jgi:nucleoid-associated protein YgaU|nr:LysM peptidoglycan-binding domain-containing protein [Treponema sp.]